MLARSGTAVTLGFAGVRILEGTDELITGAEGAFVVRPASATGVSGVAGFLTGTLEMNSQGASLGGTVMARVNTSHVAVDEQLEVGGRTIAVQFANPGTADGLRHRDHRNAHARHRRLPEHPGLTVPSQACGTVRGPAACGSSWVVAPPSPSPAASTRWPPAYCSPTPPRPRPDRHGRMPSPPPAPSPSSASTPSPSAAPPPCAERHGRDGRPHRDFEGGSAAPVEVASPTAPSPSSPPTAATIGVARPVAHRRPGDRRTANGDTGLGLRGGAGPLADRPPCATARHLGPRGDRRCRPDHRHLVSTSPASPSAQASRWR